MIPISKKYILLFILFYISFSSVFANNNGSEVLVIHSYTREFLWTRHLDDAISDTLIKNESDITLHIEYMDTKRYSVSLIEDDLLNLYKKKYQSTDLDLVILTDDNAINFVRKYRNELFGLTPILFCGLNRFPSVDLLQEGMAGIVEGVDISSNIELISTVLPDLETIYVVVGNSTSSQETLFELKRLIDKNPQWKPIEIITNVSFTELEIKLKELPSNSAVLNLAFWLDREGNSMGHNEILPLIAGSSNAPVFSLWDHTIQYGAIGGDVLSGSLHGEEIAKKGVEVLNGKPLSAIGIVEHRSTYPFLKYDIINKYKLDKRVIPEDVELKGKPVSFFVLHRKVIIISSIIISILSFLVIWLMKVNKKLNRANKEIDEMNKHLAEKVEERTRQLEHSMDQLIASEKQGLLINIINGMAHTFNTPLGIALTSLDIVKYETIKLNPGEELLQGIELLSNNMDRMINVLKQMKQYSNMEGKTEGLLFDVESCLEVLQLGISNHKKSEVKYVYDCPKDVQIYGHPTVLTKILLFLIENSMVHGFENTDKGKISITVNQYPNELSIDYMDNGIGIDETDRDSIFDPFYSGSGRKKMSGLGLSISRKLLQEEFKGNIKLCDSSEGVHFKILLSTTKHIGRK